MARERKGFIIERDKRLHARVGYTDELGRRRDILRRARTRTHARELIREITNELAQRGGRIFDGSRMTFAELAAYFEKHYLKPAEYVDGRKIEGVRSLKPAKHVVRVLKKYFGNRRLGSNEVVRWRHSLRRASLELFTFTFNYAHRRLRGNNSC